MHRVLTITKWYSNAFETLEKGLKGEFIHISKSVRHLSLRAIVDKDLWIETEALEWMDSKAAAKEFREDIYDEMDVPDYDVYRDGMEEKMMEDLEKRGSRVAEDRLEEEEEELDWIADRQEAEDGLFRLLKLLPSVVLVELEGLQLQVDTYSKLEESEDEEEEEEEAEEQEELSDGPSSSLETSDDDAAPPSKPTTFKYSRTAFRDYLPRPPPPPPPSLKLNPRFPSAILTLSLKNCGPNFRSTIRRHWRFAKSKIREVKA